MDLLISAFFSVLTLSRVFNTFILGFFIGRALNPTNREVYNLAIYLLVFLVLGIVPSILTLNEELIGRGIAALLLWVFSNICLLIGRSSRRIKLDLNRLGE